MRVCDREKEIIIIMMMIVMMMEICKAPTLRLKDRGTACVCERELCECAHICNLRAVGHAFFFFSFFFLFFVCLSQ